MSRVVSDFAVIDITRGRNKLFRRVGGGAFGGEMGVRVPVVITGYIVGAFGPDDGESREFEVDVEDVVVG